MNCFYDDADNDDFVVDDDDFAYRIRFVCLFDDDDANDGDGLPIWFMVLF